MPLTLTIGSTTVPVRATSGDVELEDLAFSGQMFDGSLSTTQRSAVTHARILDVETPVSLTRAEALDLLDDLAAVGFVSVDGSLWGDAAEADVEEITREEGELIDHIRLRFRLRERVAP